MIQDAPTKGNATPGLNKHLEDILQAGGTPIEGKQTKN